MINIETQSLNVDFSDSARFSLSNEDADIWSIDEESSVDDVSTKRTYFPKNRSQLFVINSNSSDTQSVESSTSQQEIMPADIRKRLSDAKGIGGGPTLFEVNTLETKNDKLIFCFLKA